MDNTYYDEDSLEYIKMDNEIIEIDDSVLTDLTLVIECDFVSHEDVYDYLSVLKNHYLHVELYFNQYYLMSRNLMYLEDDYIDKNVNLKIFENKIEIPIGIFNHHYNDVDHHGFTLFLFNRMNYFKKSIKIKTNILNELMSHINGSQCYFKYKKYNVHADINISDNFTYYTNLFEYIDPDEFIYQNDNNKLTIHIDECNIDSIFK